MTSEGYVRGLASIHISEDIDSAHIDYDMVENLNLHEVENYGITGTVQLINIISDATKNLLSSSCKLWSDGTARKLDRAMFLRVYQNQRDTSHSLGVFLITQIDASDDLLTLTFCDCVQYLRSVGADYVRNFTPQLPTWHDSPTAWDSANGYAYIEIPEDVPITPRGELYGDTRFWKKTETSYSPSEDRSIYIHEDKTLTITMDLPDTVEAFDNIKLYFQGNSGTQNANVKGYLYNKSSSSTGDQLFSETIQLTSSSTVEKIFGSHHELKRDSYDAIHIIIDGVTKTGNIDYIALIVGVGSVSGVKIVYDGEEKDLSLKYSAKWSTLYCDTVVGYAVSGTSKWQIESVGGQTLTEDEFDPNWLGKAAFKYVPKQYSTAAGVIFQSILHAMSFDCNLASNTREVNQFRCNGDYIHNYLLALADMPNGDRQFAFRADKTTWNYIHTGYRFKSSDASQKTLKHGGQSGSGTVFMKFNPSISLKNHPRLAVAKGTDDKDNPIMVAVMDPNVLIGASIPTVNGSMTDPVEGALATYSDVITNRSNNWQGEIEVSGIDFAYFQTGEYVGGIPITINDDRYGFVSYRAKVREVKHDFNNQTTTIEINNYSEMYANGSVDTSKMAYSAGDMSAEASNTDMFCRQFVNIDATSMTSDGSTNDCSFYVDSGNEGRIYDATTIDLPELNIRVVNAYFPKGTGQANTQYGVNSVRVGNRTHNIPTARRPDKQDNQSLIVNVIYRLS